MLRLLFLALVAAGSAAAQAPFVNLGTGPGGAPLSGQVDHIGVVGDSVLAVGIFRRAGLTPLSSHAWRADGRWTLTERPGDGRFITDVASDSDGALVVGVDRDNSNDADEL